MVLPSISCETLLTKGVQMSLFMGCLCCLPSASSGVFQKGPSLQRPEVCWTAQMLVCMQAAYLSGLMHTLLRNVLGSGGLSLTPLLFLHSLHFK